MMRVLALPVGTGRSKLPFPLYSTMVALACLSEWEQGARQRIRRGGQMMMVPRGHVVSERFCENGAEGSIFVSITRK